MKAYADLPQSKRLAEFLPLESADMSWVSNGLGKPFARTIPIKGDPEELCACWSLSALLDVLPEINGIPLTLEKVKAEDGYDGYYYHIEYEDKILIPYSKNPVDACYEMILKLHEQKLL